MKIKNLLFLSVTFCAIFLSSKAQNLHPVNNAGDNFLAIAPSFQTSTLVATTAIDLPTPIISVNGSVPASGQKAESCFSNNSFAFAANNISGTVSYVWDFGDGGSSTSATPAHSYTVAGIYKVTLTVTDGITTTTANQFVEVSPKPVASFNVYAGTGNGNAYSFQSSSAVASGSIANYIWDFGDGSGAVTSNPDKVYAATGSYSVKLIVVSDKGCRDTTTKTVVVNLTGTPILAAFTTSTATQCLTANSFIFNNTSDNGNGETYAWNFGDGNSSSSYSPTHTYTQAGNYTVTLTVTKGANSSVAVKAITVASQPVSSFAFTVNNNVVNFTSSSTIATGYITSFNWDFGNGSTSTLQSPTHTFAASNTYLVTLTATGIGGCTGVSSQNVTVVVPPSVSTNVSAFSVSAAQCLKNNSYQFTNGSVVTGTNISYNWNFNDGNTSASFSPTHTFTVAGSYNVILTVTSSAGTSVSNQNVVVYPQPVPSFAIANTGSAYTFINTSTIASGAIASAVWTSSDGNGFTGNQYNQTFAPGNYTVKLVATSDNGCSEEITQSIAYAAPISANFSISGTALTSCFENTNNYTFTNSSTTGAGISYLWEFGDGTSSTSYSPSHQYATSGSYIVRLRVSDGSQSVYATPQVIALNPKPAPEFLLYLNTTLTSLSSEVKRCFTPGMDFSFMSSSTVAFGQMHYKWSFATNAIRFRDGDSLDYINPRIVFDTAGIYPVKLVVSTDKGCTDSVIHVIKLGHPHAKYQTSIVYSDPYAKPTVTFTDNSYDHQLAINSYQWNFGSSNISPATSTNVQNPNSFQYNCAGTYNIALRIIDEIPCTSDTGSVVIIKIRPRTQFAISAPNYTPDVYAKPTFTFTNNTTVNDGCPNLTYAWNFGDGYTSTNSNPTHIFKGSGVYNVRLIATNQNGGEKDTLTQQVTVAIKPKAIFSTNQSLIPDIYASPTVNIVNTTSSADTAAPPSALQYAWDFGDGNTSNVKNPTGHIYAAGGNYTITLTVTNLISGLTDVATRNITIAIRPKANFTANISGYDASGYPILHFVGNTSSVNETPVPVLTYSWTYGDAIGTSTSTLPSDYSYITGAASRVITLIVTNPNGSLTDTKTVTLTNVYVQPKANFTASISGYDGSGRPILHIVNSSSLSEAGQTLGYSWTYGNGIGASTNASPTDYAYPTGAASRDIVVTVTNPNGGLTDTKTVTLTNVYVQPKANFTASISGYDGSGRPILHIVNSSSLSEAGQTLGYSWTYGNGIGASTNASPTDYAYPTGAASRDIVVTVTNPNGGLTDTKTVTLTNVYVQPKANFTASISGYDGSGRPILHIVNSSSLSEAGQTLGYSWTYGDGIGTSASASPVDYAYPTGAASRDIIVTVTNPNGSATDTKTVTLTNVYSKPIIVSKSITTSSTSALVIDFITTATDNSSGTLSYTWDFGEVGGTASGNSGSYTYTTYASPGPNTFNATLTVTNTSTNVSTTVSIPVIISNKPKAKINIQTDDSGTPYLIYFDAASSTTPAGTNITNYEWSWTITGSTPSSSSSGSSPVNASPNPGSHFDWITSAMNAVDYTQQIDLTLTVTNDAGETDVVSTTYINGTSPNNYTTTARQATIDAGKISLGLSKSNTASLYPNPAFNNVVVKYQTALAGKVVISVYDMTGKQVMQQNATSTGANKINTHLINVDKLKKGAYIVEVNMYGRKLSSLQLIKAQ